MGIKKELRNFARKLMVEHQNEIDDKHVSLVVDSSEFVTAKVIAIYLSVNTEPTTELIIETAFNAGKKVAVPIFNSEEKVYLWCELKHDSEIIVGKYGIKEPQSLSPINPFDIDVCYIPGMLFDKQGVRLGHGGGFYDRLLVKLSHDTQIIGLAFPWQIVDKLPLEAHDIPCHKVITKGN